MKKMISLFIFLVFITVISIFLYQSQSIGTLIAFLVVVSLFGLIFSQPLFAISVPIFGGWFNRPFYRPYSYNVFRDRGPSRNGRTDRQYGRRR